MIMKHIKNVALYIIYSLLIVYIVIALFFPSKTTDIFGVRMLVVVSTSMEPEIDIYDMIIIRKVKQDELEEGDIITFEAYIPEINETSYVTHYLKEIRTNTLGQTIYETQGLKPVSDTYDEWTDSNGNPVDITYNDIEGLYLFKIPYIGRFVYWLRDPIFIVLLIVNGMIFYFLFKQIKAYLNKKEAN